MRSRVGYPAPDHRDDAVEATLHPGAWWVWAIAGAVAASRTTNPILLAALVAVLVVVVLARRGSGPWARAFRLYLWLAGFIIVLRVVLRIIFAAGGPTVLFRLPVLRLPGSMRLFGPVSAEALLNAAVSGLQLATMIVAIGAANALANPKRLLAAVPSALYEWGTVVVIAVSVFPQLAESVLRVRRARALRATGGRAHLIRDVMMPVLSDALARSLLLAGAMDSRGYGRSAQVAPGQRRATSLLLVTACLALCVGAYGLLDTGATPVWLGAPMVVGGVGIAAVGLRLSGRRVIRSRYRPDRWGWRESVVLVGAIVACAVVWVVGLVRPGWVNPALGLAFPPVPLAALAGLAVLLVPLAVTVRPVGAAPERTRPLGATPERVLAEVGA
jgi:energy-coupling factor transport system permease protein